MRTFARKGSQKRAKIWEGASFLLLEWQRPAACFNTTQSRPQNCKPPSSFRLGILSLFVGVFLPAEAGITTGKILHRRPFSPGINIIRLELRPGLVRLWIRVVLVRSHESDWSSARSHFVFSWRVVAIFSGMDYASSSQ